MSEYYLISQLPSLDGIGENTPLPITVERFSELCSLFTGKKTLTELKKLTVCPNTDFEPSSSALINKWNENESALRLALGKVRAERMKKSFDTGAKPLSPELIKTAETAVTAGNPLDAEQYLTSCRLAFLESIRPFDSFSDDYLFYYALKLRLLSRIKEFDISKGKTSYKNIYNTVINGKGSEDEQ